MSAIADNADGPVEIVKVLFTLYPGYNTLDVTGPLEILNRALHNSKDACKLSTHPHLSPTPQLGCHAHVYLV